MMHSPKITVVYILWFPAGFEKFSAFINSLISFKAGTAHDLVIVFKGSEHMEQDTRPYEDLLKERNISYRKLVHNSGLDIDTYFFAAKEIDSAYFLFLNTSSLILCDDWLLKY